ncbi:MAG: helix-hairpin-helix domain-containing protein [Tannerella sp.]|jgi:competence ComEA-like helix-hairpin-helix protein|nr:helix-hairpin-helix domain-containing protein [Tannerella sp.]
MAWRDFLYLSRGERQALAVLLGMIVITGLLLILRLPPASVPDEEAASPVASQSSTPDTPAQAVPITPEKPSARQQVEPRTAAKRRESVSERVQRMTSRNRPRYTEKFEPGTTLEINTADTAALKKVPGIGSAFAARIVKYRNLLGGYHTVTQLREVYGIDEDRYAALSPWFTVEASHVRKLSVNSLPMDSLRKHPYISYRQARAIERLRRQKKQLSGWENLQLLEEFTEDDQRRILPYLSFE